MADSQSYRKQSSQNNEQPRGYEAQYPNQKYSNQSHDWMTDNPPQGSKDQSSNQNLNNLQKEFLKNEYYQQQEDLRKKKDDALRQKENDFVGQQELQRQIEIENQLERQLAQDKKKALGDLYRVQIEQANRNKEKKRYDDAQDDKQRLQQVMERNGQEVRTNQQREQRLQDYQANQAKGESFMNKIGNGDDKRKAHLERFEQRSVQNGLNFVSYEEEKQKKAEVYSNQNQRQLPSFQKDQVEAQYGGIDKRDYNETLKRQMVENQMKKDYEKQERQRTYDLPPKQPQQQQQIYSQQSRQQQQQRQELFDIMGNPKNSYSEASSSSGTANSKKEEQIRYRQQLDAQTQQQKLLKSRNDEGSEWQYDNRKPPLGSHNSPISQVGQEYDVMGNRKNVYQAQGGQSQGSNSKKDEQQKYREYLNEQKEQNRMAKEREEDEMADLERRLNENMAINSPNQGREIQGKMGYNPVTNAVQMLPQQSGQRNYNDNSNRRGSSQSGKGSQQRIDYSDFANKNILSHNY